MSETAKELSKRVVRDEPGVLEIHVEAREVLRDGPMRVDCWWSEEDGAYLARLTDAEESTRPFTSTHTNHGATREEALANLAIGEYVLALAEAATRPAPAPSGSVEGEREEVTRIAQKVIACGPIAKGARLMFGSGTKYDGFLVGSHADPLTFGEVRTLADAALRAAPPVPSEVSEEYDFAHAVAQADRHVEGMPPFYAWGDNEAAHHLAESVKELRDLVREVADAATPRTFVVTEAARLVLAERERQKAVEGWSTAHDDGHTDGSLAQAASCYADPFRVLRSPSDWPWALKWWKPTPDNRVRELVKAGALILAEIERLQREARLNADAAALSRGREG